MKFHAIAGLPRAGSTLLCNVLAQNPRFQVSSTSPLISALGACSVALSNSVEFRNLLNSNRESSESRLQRAIKGFAEGWYSGSDVVLDKSRGWMRHVGMFRKVWPAGKILALVRDPREVLASIEKQNHKTPLFNEGQGPIPQSERFRRLLSPNGVVGGPMMWIEDSIKRRKAIGEGIIFVQFESLCENPESVIGKIYEKLGEERFAHDLNNIQKSCDEPDGFWLWKYPHDGVGRIGPQAGDWMEWVPKVVGVSLARMFPVFFQTFGYVVKEISRDGVLADVL